MIAEIVGPAGAGKTTIARALSQRNSAIRCDFDIRFRQFLPAFCARAASLLPAKLLRYRKIDSAYWSALLRLAYLDKLYSVLSRHNSIDGEIFFLDQAPVYWLTYLWEFGSAGHKDQSLDQWWIRSLRDWAAILDVIIWVDARDEILLQRICDRQKWHGVKNLSEKEAREFLVRHRKAYWHVISMLTSDGGPRVLSFSTDQEPSDWIEERILDVLGVGSGGHRAERVSAGGVQVVKKGDS